MPETTVIIGIGNEYRGDDAAGLLVARMLRTLLALAMLELAICECDGDGTALLDLWKGAENVILIDASCSGLRAGTITCFDPLISPLPLTSLPSSHAFGPAEAIGLARQLDELPPKLTVYAIEGKQFATGADPSPEVEQAVRAVAARVKAALQTAL
jgi:hydrogenase maturation protease